MINVPFKILLIPVYTATAGRFNRNTFQMALTPSGQRSKIRHMSSLGINKSYFHAFTRTLLILLLLLGFVSRASPVGASPEALRWSKVNIPAGGAAGHWAP